jgi:hypothetical protein
VAVLASDTERANRRPLIDIALRKVAFAEGVTLRFETVFHTG